MPLGWAWLTILVILFYFIFLVMLYYLFLVKVVWEEKEESGKEMSWVW